MSVWRSGLFDVQFSFSSDHFVGVCAKNWDKLFSLVNVYLSYNMAGKRGLWDELHGLKCDFPVSDWWVAGDFDVVVSREERREF